MPSSSLMGRKTLPSEEAPKLRMDTSKPVLPSMRYCICQLPYLLTSLARARKRLVISCKRGKPFRCRRAALQTGITSDLKGVDVIAGFAIRAFDFDSAFGHGFVFGFLDITPTLPIIDCGIGDPFVMRELGSLAQLKIQQSGAGRNIVPFVAGDNFAPPLRFFVVVISRKSCLY